VNNLITIPKVEFYITNVCNLSCTDCNRYNNYKFTGWQRWSDYEADYAQWAERVRINQIVILGGEPLLNPSIIDWVKGINKLWKQTVQILSNGTRLNETPGLYEALDWSTKSEPWSKNWIGISLHNENDLNGMIAEIRKFLRGKIEMRADKTQLDPQGFSVTHGADYWFCDENNIRVLIWIQDSFYNVAVHKNKHGALTLHHNNPEDAHRQCGFAMFKCYHFIRGSLYKCGPVALFPEFDQQHPLALTDSERELMLSYRPLHVSEFDERGKEFLDTIDNPIPQCRFCPVTLRNQKIHAIRKGLDENTISNFGG
jgi:hypothetical protein